MKVCFTGGGSAGHLFPAFQVDEELSTRTVKAHGTYVRFWIGTTDERERGWVMAAGIPFHGIASGKLRRYASLRNIIDIFNLFRALFQAYAILRRERPDVVFSKGGFASVPPVVAAWLLRIPSVTHESDANPGLATRINARFARWVCVSHAQAGGSFSKRFTHKLVVTGNPVRFSRAQGNAQRARMQLGIGAGTPLLVVLGGSQGALQLNELVWNHIEELTSFAFVFHQMGSSKFKEISHERYKGVSFVQEGMADLLAAATVVLSRSGANAVGELLEMRKAMVLVPLGKNASRGDQVLNAERIRAAGAAVVVSEEQYDESYCVRLLADLMGDESRRKELERNCENLRSSDARCKIADVIEGLIKAKESA